MEIEKAHRLLTRAKPTLKDARLRLALLKENFEYRAFFIEFMKWSKKNPTPEVWPGLAFQRIFHLNLHPGSPLYANILKAVDPFEENPPDIDYYLRNLFNDSAVTLIDTGEQPPEGPHIRSLRNFLDERKPWERLYRVDLRKPKAQIRAEFDVFLDYAFGEKADKDHHPSYDDWQAYNARKREEAWQHLEVWKLRKKKESFFNIARALNISVDVAKKSFARAYELIQHKRYDPVLYRREAWTIKIEALGRTCATCPNRATCTELCPEMLAFVEQDQTAQREKLLENSEYIDSLSFGKVF